MWKKPQRKYRNFYTEWLLRSVRGAFEGIGIEGGADIMRGIVLWAFTVLILWTVNWSKVPIIGTLDAEPASEVRLGLCALVAIVAVFVGFFVFHLIFQPVRIHKESWNLIEENEKLIAAIGDSEGDRKFLSEQRGEGFKLYRAAIDVSDPKSIAEWRSNMDAWVDKIRKHLKERWSISALLEFEDIGSSGSASYQRENFGEMEHIRNEQGMSLLSIYTGYLQSLNQIIRFGAYNHLGDVTELMLKRELIKNIEHVTGNH